MARGAKRVENAINSFVKAATELEKAGIELSDDIQKKEGEIKDLQAEKARLSGAKDQAARIASKLADLIL